VDRTTNAAKAAWLDGLEALGLKPGLTILAKADDNSAADIEMYWIEQGIERGWPLTNFAKGIKESLAELYLAHVHPRVRGYYQSLSTEDQNAVSMKAVQIAALLAIQLPLTLGIRTGRLRHWFNVVAWAVAHWMGHFMILQRIRVRYGAETAIHS